MTRQELIDTLSTKANTLNRNIRSIEKNKQIGAYSWYRKLKKEVPTGQKPRFIENKNTLSRYSNNDLEYMLNQIEEINKGKIRPKEAEAFYNEYRTKRIKQVVSNWHNKAKRMATIPTKEIRGINNALFKRMNEEGITEAQIEQFFKEGGGSLLNNKTLDSSQVLEDFIDYSTNGLTVAQFVSGMREYLDKEITIDEIHDYLNTKAGQEVK